MSRFCVPARAVVRVFSGALVALTVLLGYGNVGQASTGTSVSTAPLVHFPADQAQHPSANNEWWYVVGHVRSGGHRFGYETTIFKFARIRPPGLDVPITLYRTDIAITDEKAKKFHQKVTYYFPESAALSAGGLSERVGSASLRGSSAGDMQLTASTSGIGISMHLSSRRHPMYVGGRGYIPFANGYTYYYSLTDLASSGTLKVGGTTYHVTGTSWLDHQWGKWSWSTVRGWTWMALQLNNGVQLSVFDFRSTSSRVRAASVLLADGKLRTVWGTTISSTGTWRSPQTHGAYPSGWVVHIPALGASLRIAPAVKDQELVVPSQNAGSYWEGSGHITGTWEGKKVTGLSYTELTGYAGKSGAP